MLLLLLVLVSMLAPRPDPSPLLRNFEDGQFNGLYYFICSMLVLLCFEKIYTDQFNAGYRWLKLVLRRCSQPDSMMLSR